MAERFETYYVSALPTANTSSKNITLPRQSVLVGYSAYCSVLSATLTYACLWNATVAIQNVICGNDFRVNNFVTLPVYQLLDAGVYVIHFSNNSGGNANFQIRLTFREK